jgi:hypothetical protein
VKPHPDLRPTIYTRSISSSKAHVNFKLSAARALYTHLTSNRAIYSVFPCTLRGHPEVARARLGLAELVAHGILQPCPVLVEKSAKAIVVRRTVTVFIRKQGEVIVLGGGDSEVGVMWVKSERGMRAGGILETSLQEPTKVIELKREEKMDLDG